MFTADVGGYSISPGVKPPQITVTVREETVITITDWTFVDIDFLTGGELALPGVSEENQADFDTVVSMLPTQIRAETDKADTAGEAGGDVREQSGTNREILELAGWSCPVNISFQRSCLRVISALHCPKYG